MAPVADLLGPRTRVSKIARASGTPIGTVWSWKKNGNIPPWRRPAVLAATEALEIEISDDVRSYLAQAA